MTWAWYLLALLPTAAITYIVWAYRKRNAARAAASGDRYAQIFKPLMARAAAPEAAEAALSGRTAGAAPEARGTGAYARRARLLTAQQADLRELLKSGLPDHEILSSVSLAAVIEVCGLPEGRAREQRLRALTQHTVDCVVCGSALEVVAVLDLENGSAADARFKSECLKAAGVRYLRWNPLEFPRSNDLSALILGG